MAPDAPTSASFLVHPRLPHNFDLIRQRHASLSCLPDPVALLDALHNSSGASEQKNTVLEALVEAAQSRTAEARLRRQHIPPRPLAGSRRRLSSSLPAPSRDTDDVAAEILAHAVEAIHDLDLGRVHRIAATIVMNTERDLGRDRVREARRQNLRVDLDVDEIAGREPSLSRDLLHRDVARFVGGDAGLVLRVAVDGFSQVEVAAELGLSEAATRKRYQRATRRLGQMYADGMSRSTSRPGFSGSSAPALSPEKDGPMAHIDDTTSDLLTRIPGLFRRWELPKSSRPAAPIVSKRQAPTLTGRP